jgi:hypothetical protein
MPPKSEVAINRLMRKVAAAWLRDVEVGKTTPERAFPQIDTLGGRGGMSDEELLDGMLESLSSLLGVWRWRSAYLRNTPEKVPFADAQDFTPAMAAAWEAVLAPWLEGRAELNHSAFAAFMQDRPEAPTNLGKSRRARKRRPPRRKKG